jgi:hypothetical protein
MSRSLPARPNPLAATLPVQQNKADISGIQHAMAKRGACLANNPALYAGMKRSPAGESGLKYKVDKDADSKGEEAFKSLDHYMKKAGLNSFQANFFGRLIQSGYDEAAINFAVKQASARFGSKVASELNSGMEKLGIWGALARGASAALPYAKSALRPAWHFSKGLFGGSAPSVANKIGKGVGLTTAAVAPTAASIYAMQGMGPEIGKHIGQGIGDSEQVGKHLDRISHSVGQAAGAVGNAASGVDALARPFVGEDGKPNWLQGLLQSSGSAGQFFQNNKDWLVPSLIGGLGVGGGYMLGGGTGAALGGIGLPLLYALFQNRDQLGLGGFLGNANQPQKETPPAAPSAAPPTVPTAPAASPAATQGNTGTIYDTYKSPEVAQQPQPAQPQQFQPMQNEVERQKTMQQPGQ